MDDTLTRMVWNRIEAASVDTEVGLLAVAACDGDEELAAALEGTDRPQRPAPEPPRAPPEPAGAYLEAVSAEGFRGIGGAKRLELAAGPGLTLMVGRNGSGKSSFAEALEVTLTGDNQRWSSRREKAWREGWRNLHHPSPTWVEAELSVEGERGTTTVRREWAAGAALDQGTGWVQRPGSRRAGLDDLGWSAGLSTYRPFLSYNELGSLLEEGPSKLYDALSSVLGLEELDAAAKRLAAARTARKKAHDAAKEQLQQLLPELEALDDERARACVAALRPRTWQLGAVEGLVRGDEAPAATESRLQLLRALARLTAPSLEQVEEAVEQLRRRAGAAEAFAGTDAERAQHTADLLERAARLHDRHGEVDCPVCGRAAALDDTWRADARTEIERLRAQARDVNEARRLLHEAIRRAHSLLVEAPGELARAEEAGVDASAARGSWVDWRAGLEIVAPLELAAHLEGQVLALSTRLDEVAAAAADEVGRLQDRWRPLAAALLRWLPPAQEALRGAAQIKTLKAAEDWLRGEEARLRDERFEPIAAYSQRVWELLRQTSNVELQAVELQGKGLRRRVGMRVAVDGVDGIALGVMSQGELHALALSLFLPRAMLPDSPFRFLVIDDPVQSMDPARVDGLARVLSDAARTRQVVVFTHDDRLPEAVRRLQIPARVVGVTRKAGSIVELREETDPIDRYLDDARALALTDDLPRPVAQRVVPGLCRSAIEAACVEAVRRRRLRRGEQHNEVEDLLTSVASTMQFAALALHDDAQRGGDVYAGLRRFGPGSIETFKACQSGAHGTFHGPLLGLVSDAGKLADHLRRQ